MSAESSLLSSLLSRGNNESLLQAIAIMIEKLDNVVESFEKPFVFMQAGNDTISGNLPADTILIRGTPVPRGFRGIIKDTNVNFGTAAGAVKLVILNSAGNIRNDVLDDITSNTSGIGSIVLNEGDQIALVVQTQGASTFGCYFSGKIMRVGKNGV